MKRRKKAVKVLGVPLIASGLYTKKQFKKAKPKKGESMWGGKRL